MLVSYYDQPNILSLMIVNTELGTLKLFAIISIIFYKIIGQKMGPLGYFTDVIGQISHL